jgi:hypothetical protein
MTMKRLDARDAALRQVAAEHDGDVAPCARPAAISRALGASRLVTYAG